MFKIFAITVVKNQPVYSMLDVKEFSTRIPQILGKTTALCPTGEIFLK